MSYHYLFNEQMACLKGRKARHDYACNLIAYVTFVVGLLAYLAYANLYQLMGWPY